MRQAVVELPRPGAKKGLPPKLPRNEEGQGRPQVTPRKQKIWSSPGRPDKQVTSVNFTGAEIDDEVHARTAKLYRIVAINAPTAKSRTAS